MARLLINYFAATAMVNAAKDYARGHGVEPSEMGTAMLLASCAILSGGLNDVQMDEAYAQLKELTAPLRQGQRS